ncbi:MAG: 16S rRNA (guanine(527)-N(7))-methyltransferase RsmG [Candidatus Kapaibacterium sp.]
MDKLEFWTICSANGIVLEKEDVDIFERYHGDLLYWNTRVNLVSRKDEENIWERHILHSLGLLTAVTFAPRARVVDVGTGGGFPGIPLKIARPDLTVVCVDSITKKAKMTVMFAEHTGLRALSVENCRVESLTEQPKHRGAYDTVVARAVAPLAEIVGWTRKLLKPGGTYALLKGGDLAEEIAEARREFPTLRVDERPLVMKGVPWFAEQQKKIVTASFTA